MHAARNGRGRMGSAPQRPSAGSSSGRRPGLRSAGDKSPLTPADPVVKVGSSIINITLVMARTHGSDLPTHPIEGRIHTIRGHRVMLDADLAALYGVQTKVLNQAVKRNSARFPEDFMFVLTPQEVARLRSQIVTSNSGSGGRRYLPYAFTEHGVVMLSAVLNSQRAVEMSIQVVRAFIRMRELIAANKDIAARVEKLERGHDRTASVIEVLVEDIDRLAHEVRQMKALPESPKRKIGFDL
jgi:phage regulator Rha-like protein